MNTLTARELINGHVQRDEHLDNKVELYKDHSIYHVRLIKDRKRIHWKCFETLRKARQCYGQYLKQLNN